MTLLEFFILLIIAGICGSLAQALAGYSHGGCLVSIALGFIGALLGSWIAHRAGLPEPLLISVAGAPFPFLWSVIGAALFVAVVVMLSGGRRA